MKTRIVSTIISVLVSLALPFGCFAQTQLVADNFSGTNGTYLDSNWVGCGYNGGAYSELVYESNAAGGSGNNSQNCALYTGYGAFPGDQYATATVVAPVPSSTVQASIQLRGNVVPGTSESYIACGWDAQDFPPDYHYRVWSLTPGAPGPVSLWLSGIVPATNDVINCQVLGNTVSMTLNGNVVATVTDTSGNNSGYPGLYYNDPNSGGPLLTDIIFASFSAGSGPSIVSTTIAPTSAAITTGSFVQYNGTISYANGIVAPMGGWSSSDTSVAPVDVTGTAFGLNSGNVTVTGASGPDSVTGTLAVAAENGYTPLVYDTFVGSGGSYLGSNWTGCGFDSGAYSKLVYQNNQAGGSGYGSQNCALYTGLAMFPSDQFATAVVVSPSPASTPEASIELRGNPISGQPESYIACGWDAQDFPADQHYRIWSLTPGGTPSSLYLSSITPVTNDLIWCQVLGTTVTMQVNGTTIAIVNADLGLNSGYPGMFYIDKNDGPPPVTDVIFDNFAAGSINNAVIATITLSPASSTINSASSVQLTATGTYTDGTVADVTSSVNWASSNPFVATVNTAGLATGVSTGTATITASYGMGSGTASLAVTMFTPSVAFTGAPASAPYLGTFSVTAMTNAPVMPTIDGTAGVCSVGIVTGTPTAASTVVTMIAATGTCILTANWPAAGGYSAAGPLTQSTIMLAAIASIAVSPASSTINANASAQFTASGTFTDGTVANVTNSVSWASSNTSVSSVNAAGLAIGVGVGTATITASYGTVSGTANLVVNALTPSVAFSGAPSTGSYLSTFSVTATTNASVMPSISGTAGVCSVGTVTGNPASASAVVSMLSGTGTCVLTANWPAAGNYSAAVPLTQSTTATKIAPKITFTGAPVSSGYGSSFNVTATTNASTLPQITASGSTGVCTVGVVSGSPTSASAGVTMISGTGTCKVVATWAADANYSAPSSITQSTSATRVQSATSIVSSTPNPSTLKQAVTISFSVSGVGSGPTGSVTITASNGQSCQGTLSAAHTGSCAIALTKSGNSTLSAQYSGDSNFNSSRSTNVSQTVNSPTVSLSPSGINFGTVAIGTTQTSAETISNTGSGALINLAWSISGQNANMYSVSSTTCGTTLNPGAKCIVNVTFKPTSSRSKNATLNLSDNAPNSPQSVGLYGTGR